ncbi:hypothetical protein MKW98_009141, partial [Papaver atlanticum]
FYLKGCFFWKCNAQTMHNALSLLSRAFLKNLGANDVSMIQMADVGISITGQEGRQAVMASNFSMEFEKKEILNADMAVKSVEWQPWELGEFQTGSGLNNLRTVTTVEMRQRNMPNAQSSKEESLDTVGCKRWVSIKQNRSQSKVNTPGPFEHIMMG